MSERRAVEVHGRPAAPLRPFVTSYVGFRLDGFPAGVHLGLPHRGLTAVISLSAPLAVAEVPEGRATVDGGRFGSLCTGLRTRSVAIHHDGRQHGIRLSLTPLGARAIYGLPAAELAGTLVPLVDLLGPLGPELLDRLWAATTWRERFAVLDELLTRAVGRHVGDGALAVRPEVAELWRRLVAARGQVRVGAVAAELGWSRRHLGERFRAEVGVTPKAFARIVRFEHAHRLASRQDPPSWAEVSAQAGYADQAHMVRDWRAFTGRTPEAWRRGEMLPEGEGH